MAKEPDVFTSTGVLISPQVREMQLEFHDLQFQRQRLVQGIAPVRKRYKELRKQGYSWHPEFPELKDKIAASNEAFTIVDNRMGALTKAVEAIHVLAKDGVNARPGVATMGKPKMQ